MWWWYLETLPAPHVPMELWVRWFGISHGLPYGLPGTHGCVPPAWPAQLALTPLWPASGSSEGHVCSDNTGDAPRTVPVLLQPPHSVHHLHCPPPPAPPTPRRGNRQHPPTHGLGCRLGHRCRAAGRGLLGWGTGSTGMLTALTHSLSPPCSAPGSRHMFRIRLSDFSIPGSFARGRAFFLLFFFLFFPLFIFF